MQGPQYVACTIFVGVCRQDCRCRILWPAVTWDLKLVEELLPASQRREQARLIRCIIQMDPDSDTIRLRRGAPVLPIVKQILLPFECRIWIGGRG